MSTPDQVIGRVQNVATAVKNRQSAALQQAGNAARSVMRGVPGVPSRVADRPVDVRVKILDASTAMVRYDPLMRLVDSPTQAHFIARRGGRGRGALGSLRHQNLEDALLRTQGRSSRRASAFIGRALTGQQAGVDMVRGPINIPGVGYRAWAFQKGTKGKEFSPVGKALARPVITETFGRVMLTEPLRAAFHG